MAALGEHLPATRRGVIDLGSRRELFVDDYLIERRRSTSLVLQAPTHEIACVAESRDGIHWVRPKLGLREFDGSTANNIIWDGVGSHNFAVLKDTNPACVPSQRDKALGSKGKHNLFAFASPDGVRDIMVCTSPDFIGWSDLKWLDYGDAPPEEFYTNATVAYSRGPHILMGIPMRFPGRSSRPGEGCNVLQG